MQDDGDFCIYRRGSPSPLFRTMSEAPIVDVANTRPSGPALRIVNVTPLQLVATSAFSFCELKPFVPVDYPWGDAPWGGVINVIHRESNALIRELRRDQLANPTVTIDTPFVRNPKNPVPAARAEQRERLRVINNTSYIVDAYWLGASNEERRGRIEPGQSWETPTNLGQLWEFRSAFSGETLGMTMAAPSAGNWPTETYTVTQAFREARLAAQQQIEDPSSTPTFAPLRLIGERRKSTPKLDDQSFLTAATVRQEFQKEVFNGLPNRVLRDVEIAGALLRWSGSNRVLAAYYGEAAADLRALTIYADRMEVADRLRFPRTNVTIYARELIFTGPGGIDTTPLDYPTRAKSEYLTQDPEDLTNANMPADAEGRPTYIAADGARGEPSGSITLHVRRLIVNGENRKRFICRGGKGQTAEPGGLKAYVVKDGYPEKYGPLTAITANDVADFFQPNNCYKDPCSQYRWPGEVDWPWDVRFPNPPCDVLKTGKVVAITLLAHCDDAWGTAAGLAAWGERGFLPGREYTHWVNPRGMYGNYEEWPDYEGVPNPAKRPCDGRDAYPGGWPGDGGDGGVVTSTLASAPVEAGMCELSPGQPGEPTAQVPGAAPPGPTPAYSAKLKIVRKSAIKSGRQPEISVTEVSGQNGKSAPGRHYSGAVAKPAIGEQMRVSQAKRGNLNNAMQKDDLSWAHPAAVAAVVNYARTAYRNGFRGEAAAALDPYYALATDDPVKLASTDTDLRLALVSVVAMRNNLIQNLDYYGNPPGWVPRLNALSNLSVLKSVREAAYATYYFSNKMLSDYESLENARAVSQETSKALATEMEVAQKQLQAAYDELPKSVTTLDAVQQEIVPVKDELVSLRKEAVEKSKDKVMVQRFFSAAFQIAGGVAKALPVGQPFVGLAGSALGAIGEFDWNAEDPLASARSSLNSLSSQVTTFVTDKRDSVLTAVTSDLDGLGRKREALVTTLTRQLEDEEKDPATNEQSAEAEWTEFKTQERKHLDSQIKEANDAIEDIKKRRKDAGEPESQEEQAGGEFLALLKKQKDALDEKRLGTLRKGLVVYRKQQAELEKLARLAAKAHNAKLKEAAAKTAGSDTPPTVKQKLLEATRESENHKALVAAREDTAKKVMSSLEGLGSGLSSIGNAVISLTAPLTEDDPTVKRLADQMLVEDPILREKGRKLNLKLMEILERKKQAAAKLIYWQQQASTSAATVTSNLAAMTALSRQRQSLDQGLDPAVQGYLKDARERAKDALAESIYWFVKSYQYEHLKDVDDSFYNFDAWAEKLRKLEQTRQTAATTTAAPSEGSPVSVSKGGSGVLTKEDFNSIGDEVFKAEQLKLGQDLLQMRQERGKKFSGTYLSCVLKREKVPKDAEAVRANQMLDSLAENGEATFNFVSDFGKGSFDWNDARVVSVTLTRFTVNTDDKNLSLTIRIEQTGDQIIAKNIKDEGRVFYVFRPGRDSDPISWQFVYNQAAKNTEYGLTQSLTLDPIEATTKALINSELKDFQEYSPSLFSNYKIRITDLFNKGKIKKRIKDLKSVEHVEMEVVLSSV